MACPGDSLRTEYQNIFHAGTVFIVPVFQVLTYERIFLKVTYFPIISWLVYLTMRRPPRKSLRCISKFIRRSSTFYGVFHWVDLVQATFFFDDRNLTWI